MGRHVGKSAFKVDGPSLVTGSAVYTDDAAPRDCLHLAFLRSPHGFAKITALDASGAEAEPGVRLVLSHKNVDRIFYTTAGQGYPEPSPYDCCLFDTVMRFVGDIAAAVVADSREAAEKACGRIRVTYEPLTPVFDPREALKPGSPVLHPEPQARAMIPGPYEPLRNIPDLIDVEVGDFGKG